MTLVAGCGGGAGATTTSTAPQAADSTSSSTAPLADTTSTTAAPTTTARPLPPHEKEDLVEALGAIALPLGYEISRAALIDRDTYEVTPEGGHLAIYLAPVSDLSVDEFAADLPAIASAFIPLVFDRWPELESFDVCQEPFGSEQETPPSLTIVDLTREAAQELDWALVDLPTLIGAASEVDGLTVWARSAVRNSATWQAATGA